MSSNNLAEREQGRSLVNRPEMRLASLPKRAKLIKRPLPSPRVFRQAAKNSSASNAPTADIDGYQIPPRAAHTVIIKVASKTPFMAIIKRVKHALDNGPQKTKGLPLTARIAAIGVNAGKNKEQSQGPIADALDDVVLIATGKAIQRAFEAAFLLRRNKELVVIFRTRTVSSIDDIVMDDDDEADEEDQVRVRHVSCVEIGVRWK
ncbi:Rpp20 subunit of nuclear RNase MRP and P-domain-containing protein [Cercophora newfieldiana]|uniref:Rpp20 subunit of nuclear RNase MRP and P-domain-containing protein n=1 Tax=Cercophora newfieldiana TaxID=92897 RepID=A0AA39YMJ4_9PEZI|nr:Rpp20 subunit of nuclear RNase MRP and P-domain-containing protein [Cercophora newfieldiana]